MKETDALQLLTEVSALIQLDCRGRSANEKASTALNKSMTCHVWTAPHKGAAAEASSQQETGCSRVYGLSAGHD
jgi:hypothetical protein